MKEKIIEKLSGFFESSKLKLVKELYLKNFVVVVKTVTDGKYGSSNFVEETLCRVPFSNFYFVYGHGEANTRYRQWDFGHESFIGGEEYKLIPGCDVSNWMRGV
jgi:hypothetical protein